MSAHTTDTHATVRRPVEQAGAKGRNLLTVPEGKQGYDAYGVPAYAYSTELPVQVLSAKYKWARDAELL